MPMEDRAAMLAAELQARGEHVTPDLRVLPDVAARMIGVSEGTMRNWRNADAGPDYYRIGRVWYRLVDILRWIESHRSTIAT